MRNYIAALARVPESKKLVQMVYRILETVDPDFLNERSYFDVACIHLNYVMQGERASLLADVLTAEEDRMNTNLAYLVWLGVFHNYACYVDKRNSCFLNEDFEEIHTEAFMNGFPEMDNLEEASKSLEHTLKDGEDKYIYMVTSYYCYLETVAYKYAHFAGFCLGNQVLPHLFTDYSPNWELTNNYALMIKNYLQTTD